MEGVVKIYSKKQVLPYTNISIFYGDTNIYVLTKASKIRKNSVPERFILFWKEVGMLEIVSFSSSQVATEYFQDGH